jgi:DNA-binding beta-propeller fold protein YncE
MPGETPQIVKHGRSAVQGHRTAPKTRIEGRLDVFSAFNTTAEGRLAEDRLFSQNLERPGRIMPHRGLQVRPRKKHAIPDCDSQPEGAVMQTTRGRLTAARGILPIAVLCASTIGCSGSTPGGVDRFYGIVNSPAADGKLVSIEVRAQNDVTITPIGAIGTFGCTSVALSTEGTLYSVCGPSNFVDTKHEYFCMTPGPQQLATIDPKTGHATMFGAPLEHLDVMALEFAPDGTLYAVADANPASPTFNTLYVVDRKTGALTAVGSTSVPDPDYFMDLAFDARGTMYGASMNGLFTIDRKTGTATKLTDFVGGGGVMGLGYNAKQDKLYATDWETPKSALYLVDTKNGFLTPMADIGYPLSHGLVALMP